MAVVYHWNVITGEEDNRGAGEKDTWKQEKTEKQKGGKGAGE